jgi:hypothetical protein
MNSRQVVISHETLDAIKKTYNRWEYGGHLQATYGIMILQSAIFSVHFDELFPIFAWSVLKKKLRLT